MESTISKDADVLRSWWVRHLAAVMTVSAGALCEYAGRLNSTLPEFGQTVIIFRLPRPTQ